MELTRHFSRVRFAPATVRSALAALEEIVGAPPRPWLLSVYRGSDRWALDTLDEWLGEVSMEFRQAHLGAYVGERAGLNVDLEVNYAQVSVKAEERAVALKVMSVFEDARESSAIPTIAEPTPAVKIFIGHGGSDQWRDLKDHLHEEHGYDVAAFEIGARAGHAIRDILAEMLDGSSFALLVHTGEDETADGGLRARQNVVHETGLFQGRLGFSRAVVLLEEGTEDYSNLQGIVQIRYSRGRIAETYGKVLAALRREFPT
jgi:predicted nucleotide-binding protein